jgi:integrase
MLIAAMHPPAARPGSAETQRSFGRTPTNRGAALALPRPRRLPRAGRISDQRVIQPLGRDPENGSLPRLRSRDPANIAELRTHRRQQQEQRLALGLGGAAPDDLVFPRADGEAWPPDRPSSNWAKAVRSMKLPKVTFHALRHTRMSQLIAAGLDVVTVSRRIGHSNPTVTLNVYAHLFGNTDDRAAQAVETALAGVLAG